MYNFNSTSIQPLNRTLLVRQVKASKNVIVNDKDVEPRLEVLSVSKEAAEHGHEKGDFVLLRPEAYVHVFKCKDDEVLLIHQHDILANVRNI